MNSATESFTWQGPAGDIEALLDRPAAGLPLRGTAVIAHPHPLFGGTMHNKVVQTLARACVQTGWQALRFNFRGVGASQGVHDGGAGETDDLLALIAAQVPQGPLVIAGFSFGAYVACQAVARLMPLRPPERVVLVGTAASRFSVPALDPALHEAALVLHGEQDDTVPLASVLDWARPQHLPVTVIPGVEHFFHGQLPLLRQLLVRHLR